MNEVKSHIQINKAILKNFSHKCLEYKNDKPCKYDKVFYLDFSDTEIKKEDIKELGTSFGYYSSDMETYLSKIEGLFGDEMKKAKNYTKNKIDKLEIKFDPVIKFAAFLVLRSQYILDEVNKPTIYTTLLNMFGKNPIKPHEEILKHPEIAINYLKNRFIVNLFENMSDVELVTPKNCIYEMCYVENNKPYLFIPFTPRLAFVLFELTEKNDKHDNIINLKTFNTSDDELINKFNLQAFEYEQKYSNSFIVSNRRNELEKIQEYIKEKDKNDVQ